MDLGTPLSPPSLTVPPDDSYAQGQSGEPAWATGGLEEGGWGCLGKAGGGGVPDPLPHFSHCNVSDVPFCGDSIGV